jgi:Na+-transporting NADH:ubiquinone oxidoreductase subunit NqrC
LRKSFTLIEILIAVTLFFIVVESVLNVVSVHKKLIYLFEKNKDFALKASIAFIENKNVKNNYERVIEFNIKNDNIIYILKKDKIKIEKIKDTQQEYNFSNMHFNETIEKLKAYNKYNSLIIYSIGVK